MNQDTTPMTTADKDVEEVVQVSTKRKRQMSEKQLEALAEGRKKRWLKKQEELKEEKKESTEECTDESSTEGEESKIESESESVPSISTADESAEEKSSSEQKSTQEDTESSDQTESSESEEEVPPPPVLTRQKGYSKDDKNERATEKMLKYIRAKTQPLFNYSYV